MTKTKSSRNYLKLVNEIINLQIPFRVEIIGFVTYDTVYPMLAIKHIHKLAKYTVVINSGAHGEEAVAVRVLLKSLSEMPRELLDIYNFYIFPCINPWGYSHISRRNGARQLVNNADAFKKDSSVQELRILYPHVPIHSDLFIDIHADVAKSGIYIYERKPTHIKSIASIVLKQNKKIIPFEQVDTIYQEKCIDGVIVRPEHDKSLDDYMGHLGVQYTLTVEIPGRADGQIQLVGGVSIILSILREFIKIHQEKSIVKN